MDKKVINKKIIVKCVAKMAADKAVIRSFLKGKTPASALSERGIKFARPI